MSESLDERLNQYAAKMGVDKNSARDDLLDWALAVHEQVIERTNLRISASTSMAMRHMREQGHYTGGKPEYGFALASDGVTLVEDAHEQSVIAKARELRAHGLSLRAVALTLDEQGIRGRTGRHFAAVQIARMVDESKSTEAPF